MPVNRAERLQAGIAGSEFEVFDGGHMFFPLPRQREFLARVNALSGPVSLLLPGQSLEGLRDEGPHR
ncbi:hypothetical protein, partial [Sinomonas sp.]|uniref:hypothetical protein n=1 Tax=Sinomonas sp. TaxID=1914986 RepID=UPI002FE23BF8